MDQVIISDLIAHGVIGISEQERSASQEILINVILFTNVSKASQTDWIEDCVNYSTMAKKIKALAETARRFTVEALASDIAILSLEHPLVKRVRVRVEKPGAVRSVRSVGVEIERERK